MRLIEVPPSAPVGGDPGVPQPGHASAPSHLSPMSPQSACTQRDLETIQPSQFTDPETQAQRRQETCSKSHGKLEAMPRLEPRLAELGALPQTTLPHSRCGWGALSFRSLQHVTDFCVSTLPLRKKHLWAGMASSPLSASQNFSWHCS